MPIDILKALVGALPRLRNQFSFIGFIVIVGAFLVIRQVAPDNIQAQLVAGSLGITMVLFGQVFYFLKVIPVKHRAFLIFGLFVVFCLFMVTQLGIVAYLLNKEPLSTEATQKDAIVANYIISSKDIERDWLETYNIKNLCKKLEDNIPNTLNALSDKRASSNKLEFERYFYIMRLHFFAASIENDNNRALKELIEAEKTLDNIHNFADRLGEKSWYYDGRYDFILLANETVMQVLHYKLTLDHSLLEKASENYHQMQDRYKNYFATSPIEAPYYRVITTGDSKELKNTCKGQDS